jgi:DNA-binding transcriptional regulator YdaS (Cro superfamily)
MLEEILKLYSTEREFCEVIGISRTFLYQIKKGQRPIPPTLATRIEEVTRGRIKRIDLRPDIFREPKYDPN